MPKFSTFFISLLWGTLSKAFMSPIQFVLYINDLPSSVDSEAYLYADDTKIFRIIDNLRDPEILQDDLKQLEKWSENWLLPTYSSKSGVCFFDFFLVHVFQKSVLRQ
jgi:hypothetical protein